MSMSLVSAGPSLIVCPTEMANDQALPLSLLWTQGVCSSQGLSIGTDDYFEMAVSEMGRIAWNVTEADKTTYSNSSEKTTNAKAVTDIAGQYLLPDQIASLDKAFDSLSQANPGSKVGNFVTTWWDSLSNQAQGTVFSAAPVGKTAQGPIGTTLSYFGFNASFSSWQSFFTSNTTARTDLVSQHVQLTLNTDLWSRIEGAIAQKLGKAAIASIQRLDL